MIFHAWVCRRQFCEREQNPVLTGFGKKNFWLALAKLRVVKGCEIVIFWWFYDNLLKNRFVACIFWLLMYAINMLCLIEQVYHFIECYVYFLVCLQIYAVKLWMWEKDNGLSWKIRSIDQSNSQFINKLFDKIIDQSINGDSLMTAVGKRRYNWWGWKNVVTRLGGLLGWDR